MSLALTIILSIIGSWLLLRPFFVPAADVERDLVLDSAKEQQKERFLRALEELEQEFQAGTIDQETYNLSRQELIDQASRLLQQIEQGSNGNGDSPSTVGQ